MSPKVNITPDLGRGGTWQRAKYAFGPEMAISASYHGSVRGVIACRASRALIASCARWRNSIATSSSSSSGSLVSNSGGSGRGALGENGNTLPGESVGDGFTRAVSCRQSREGITTFGGAVAGVAVVRRGAMAQQDDAGRDRLRTRGQPVAGR